MRPVRLFVYGTLQPGAETPMGEWLAARILAAEPATMSGRLHAVSDQRGWFPALLPGRRAVRGTLCTLRPGPRDLALLDRYEGVEYRRVAATARTASGRGIRAQVYLWRAVLPPGAPALRDGDFLGWLTAGGRRAFSSAQRLPLPRSRTKGPHFNRHG